MIKRIIRVIRDKIFELMTKAMGDENKRVLIPVLFGPARGLWLKIKLEKGTEAGYFYGNYELKAARLSAKIIKKDWIVWDCGVHIGFYTMLFTRLVGPKGRVIGFEPDPRNIEIAYKNVNLNGFSNVKLYNIAIGAPLGETDFILSDNTNSHLPCSYVGGTIEEYKKIEQCSQYIKIFCFSLDELYIKNKDIPSPNLIKIDIEGAEKDALKYCGRLIREVRPLIILELHNPECDTAAWEFAIRMNYSLVSMNNRRYLKTPNEVNGTLLCLPKGYGLKRL